MGANPRGAGRGAALSGIALRIDAGLLGDMRQQKRRPELGGV